MSPSRAAKLIIGTAHGKNIGLSIDELLVSRLLVQANSGGGKSFLLRRILEQAYGKVQAVVIDPAGEFATLREKYGYVLVGEHGETPADIRSAALVAEKLLELRASAVCDLYSVKPADRHIWVKRFLGAVMNAPKRLWHPVLFVVDEAHKFAPEKGEGESEAKSEMLSLASDGRKYGFCAIFATQRLAKLDKSAASELLNVLIGPTFMDIDLQRAHKALGIIPREQAAFNEQMKTIPPGHFWALGRAISRTRVLVKIGGVETTHPKAGSAGHAGEPPPAPEKVKALLPKLADLPQMAEEKARTEAEFRREIRELKTKLSLAEKQSPAAAQSRTVQDPAQAKAISLLRAAVEDAMKVVAKITAFGFEQTKVNPKQLEQAVQKAVEDIGRQIGSAGEMRRKEFEQLKREVSSLLARLEKVVDKKLNISVDVVRAQPPFVLGPASNPLPPREAPQLAADGDNHLSWPQKALLQAMRELEEIGRAEVSRSWLAFMAGVSSKSSGFEKNISTLSSSGNLFYPRAGRVALTDQGRAKTQATGAPITTAELLERVSHVISGPQALLLRVLHENHPQELSREELAAVASVSDKSSGFEKNVSTLSARELVDYPRPGFVKAADWLFVA